jgi:hypothetical protein
VVGFATEPILFACLADGIAFLHQEVANPLHAWLRMSKILSVVRRTFALLAETIASL